MPVPQLTPAQVCSIVPRARDVEFLARGGQKAVFSCTIDGAPFVLKLVLLGVTGAAAVDPEASSDPRTSALARVTREVETMAQCHCRALVKLGPIGLLRARVDGQDLLCFSEERIAGRDLADIRRTEGPLPVPQLLALAADVTEAVRALWRCAKIHRDIKPRNIMRRDGDMRFVLLDAGTVLDLADETLTAAGCLIGTPAYFSPEQMDLPRKRQLDFRSDLFSLGTVLYVMATGTHPFAAEGLSTREVIQSILTKKAEQPRALRPDLPVAVEELILRLLAKRPHMRYRSCDQLLGAVDAASRAMGPGREALP